MKKSFFLALGLLALLASCNQSPKPEPEVIHETTVIKEEPAKPAPEPGVKSVEVDKNGVKINVQDKNGNRIEIEKEHK
jgi:hypothetical protein